MKGKLLEEWEIYGIQCRIVWGAGPWACGYCQLPEEYEGQQLETFNDVNDAFDVNVHGDLTYGPDEDGWIGFDTAHAYDFWPDEELEGHNYSNAYVPLRNLIKADPNRRTWTREAMRAEVNDLAAQLAKEAK